jgi:hypothetical protein
MDVSYLRVIASNRRGQAEQREKAVHLAAHGCDQAELDADRANP